MSLIKDVRTDIRALDCSEENLIKFGRTVGGVFLLIATIVYLMRSVTNTVIVFSVAGALLVGAALTVPLMLVRVYRVWMGIAFVLGWCVSRVVLALFYFVVITPIAVIARIAGKKFLNTDFRKGQASYWIEKKAPIRYDRMS
jgi:hypothetical protein